MLGNWWPYVRSFVSVKSRVVFNDVFLYFFVSAYNGTQRIPV